MKKFFTILCSFLGLCSCGTDFDSVDVSAFAEVISREGVQLVDVRTEGEYSQGHIGGARNINVHSSSFDADVKAQLDASRPVAVYCRSGKRSAMAAAKLVKAGFKVTNLKGGILAWIDNDMPVETTNNNE